MVHIVGTMIMAMYEFKLIKHYHAFRSSTNKVESESRALTASFHIVWYRYI